MDPNASTYAQHEAKPTPGPSPSVTIGAASAFAIPDHTLLRPIGEGSYGTVWLARHTIGMYRAVKVVSRKSFKEDGPFQRELSGIRKFEPISRSHQGFVDVLHVGISGDHDLFYYVMELGDDASTVQAIDPDTYVPKTLDKEISTRGRLPFRDCLDLGLNLSQALAELHRHGLVHRDIKPSNIIFVNGVPKLADIGLVAETASANSFVGTEGFIPPEGPGTPQADVFSLGKLLYEASTGRDRQEFPELPTLLDQIPDCHQFLELNEVILQACRTDPRERYKTAWEMHADLLVLANGQSVRRLKVLERRWAKVKKVVGLSSVMGLMLVAACFLGYREWKRVIEARQQQVGANVAFGTQASESGDRLAALPYFAKALALDQGNDEREYMHRLRFGSALDQCPKLEQMWFMATELNDASFNPKGGNVVLTEYEGKAWLLDTIGTNSTKRLLDGPEAQVLQRTSYSPDGRFLVTASDDTNASIWSVQDVSILKVLPHPDKVFCANFSPDNSHVVTACRDKLVRVWNTTNDQPSLVIPGHTDAVMFAGFSPNGDRIISASKDGTARIWRASDGAQLGRSFEHGSWVGYAAMSPDGAILVTGGYEHKARIWDAATGRRIQTDLNHKAAVTSVEVSPDGRLILTASLDATACIWSLEKALPVLVLRHSAGVTRAAFAPDGHRVITACMDGSVRIWDLAGSATPALRIHGVSRDGTRFIVGCPESFQVFDTLSSNAVSPLVRLSSGQTFARTELSDNSRFVLSVLTTQPQSSPELIQVWNVADGKPLSSGVPSSNPGIIRCSADGRRLIIWTGAHTLRVWDTLTLQPLTPALTYDDGISDAVFSPDGAFLAVSFRTLVQVWDLANGKLLFPIFLHSRPVGHIRFSGDGKLLVACCLDDQVRKCSARLWDARTGSRVGKELRHKDGVLDACFSPDNRKVATAGEDFSAIIWDARTCRQTAPPLWHNDTVQSVNFAPSGRWTLTASADTAARIWNAKSGEALTPPLRHLHGLNSATFLPDERHIVTTDGHKQSWLWQLQVDGRPVEDLLALARLMSAETADLTDQENRESIATSWDNLRSKHPADFKTTEAEIIAWHAAQADESEEARILSATVFHLEALQRLTPEDQAIADRLAKARNRLVTGH